MILRKGLVETGGGQGKNILTIIVPRPPIHKIAKIIRLFFDGFYDNYSYKTAFNFYYSAFWALNTMYNLMVGD